MFLLPYYFYFLNNKRNCKQSLVQQDNFVLFIVAYLVSLFFVWMSVYSSGFFVRALGWGKGVDYLQCFPSRNQGLPVPRGAMKHVLKNIAIYV